MNNLLAPILIGSASTLLLLVFVLGVNLVLRYVRLQPWSEYDRGVTWWTVGFVVVMLLLSSVK
jgi:hypothetical protein